LIVNVDYPLEGLAEAGARIAAEKTRSSYEEERRESEE
jgi:hypothetical protein